jgi:uncharacterized membrane protein
MVNAIAGLQIALSLTVPLAVLWLEKRSKIVRAISPVVICYVVGMLFGNQPWLEFSDPTALTTCSVTVALAIPLLLFSVNIVGWLRLAKSTVLSFFFCIIAVAVSATIAHLLFRSQLDESAAIAGMLAGVYTGGTPNMAAIGTALQVREETFILLNAADMVVSFAYLLFVLTIARRILGLVLPHTPLSADTAEQGSPQTVAGLPPLKPALAALGLTALIVAAGAGLANSFSAGTRDAVAILLITTGAVVASTFDRVRRLPGTQDMGQFLLLVFCVAMGFTTDFGKLFSSPSSIIAFTAVTISGAVVIHFALAIVFRIDRDTAIITSTAAIFGPHMVGPVAVPMKNREILFSGLASGLVGYAVGNYLGIGLAWALTRWFA